MVPFIPLPPSWAPRNHHEAGSATPKRIGGAFLSTGARLPSTLQYAGVPFDSACHPGAFKVTAETGSPMALAGISEPSFAPVQSASVITLAVGAESGPAPAPACRPWRANVEMRVTAR